jgi:hypothetical protein
MSDIVVSLGAELDRSVYAEFAKLEKLAQRAAGVGSRGGRVSNSPELRAARDIYRERSRLNRQILSEEQRSQRESNKAAMAQVRQLAMERRKALREQEREERRIAQAAASLDRLRAQANFADFRRREREQLRMDAASRRAVDRFATRTSHRTTRFMFPQPEGALGMAKRVAWDITRGAGVDFSLGTGMRTARENQSAAVALSNQGWSPDQGGFANRIKPEELRAEAQKQANRLAVSESDVLGAMTRFADVTGDLETAKAVIGDIGLLARATGANLDAAASAAADMSAQLEGTPAQKTKIMQTLLGVAAMQGKRGAVEVKDLARYVPRIAAQAGAFGADADQSIVKLLAITQIARRYGGAGNAAQASTATSAMVNTLQTPSRVGAFRDAFKKAGFTGERADVFDKSGRLRDIQSLIKDSIVAAEADKDPQLAFKKMWGNVLGAKGPTGFKSIYSKAGGGQAGLAAIDAEFQKFTAGLSKPAQEQMLGSILDTTEAKAQRFQSQLDRVTESMANRLLPTMERMAPIAERVTVAFGDVVSWAAENPFKAVALALAGSLARAGLESVLRAGIDRIMTNVANSATGYGFGGAGGGGGGKSGPGFFGMPGWGNALGAAAVGAAVGGAAYGGISVAGRSDFDSTKKTTDETMKSLVNVHGKDLTGALIDAQTKLQQLESEKGIFGGAMDFFGAGTAPEIEGLRELIQRKRQEQDEFVKNGGKLTPDVLKSMAAEAEQKSWKQELDPREIGRGLTDGLQSTTLKVQVTNFPEGGGGNASVDPSVRVGP